MSWSRTSSTWRDRLRGPALERLWRTAHARRQRRGADGDARIVLSELSAEEAFALDGLPWPGRVRTVLPGTRFTTTLSRLEAAVDAAGGDLSTILSDVVGSAPRDLPAETRAARGRRLEFALWLESHPVVRAHPGLGEWVAHTRQFGVPGPRDRPLVSTALDVIGDLPRSTVVARSTLAAQLLNADPHALDSKTALCRLCTSLLAWRRGLGERPLDPIEARELWWSYGVEVDPLSCTALTLGLAPVGASPLARILHVLRGQAVIVTYAQLRAEPLMWSPDANVFTCENPVVVRAAEAALGASCPPLVCTGGWPNAAVLALLDGLRAAGASFRHHGDHDASGFAILEHLMRRLQATPWRLTPPGDPNSIGGREEQPARPMPEELALDALLGDLQRAAT